MRSPTKILIEGEVFQSNIGVTDKWPIASKSCTQINNTATIAQQHPLAEASPDRKEW